MNKKISVISIMVCIILLFVGCSAGDKPEDTVSEFIEAMKDFDLESMASNINPEDRGEMEDIESLREEEDSMEKYFVDYIESNAKKITYEIKESEIDGDKAVVSVDIKHVDGGPLFRATFEDYMKEVFEVAFTDLDGEITDEEYNEMFISSMEKQSELIEETFTEKTLEFNCIKIEDEWYIDDPSDEILDVVMANMLSIMEEIDESFDLDEEDDFDEFSMDEDVNIIEKGVGDEIELKTINFKITNVEEKDTLTPEYGSEVSAKEGAKFVVVGMEVTNTTKSEFTFPDDFMLIDSEDREFKSYSDSIGVLDDYLIQRDLPPSIKEEGHLVYEVPEDSADYYTVMGKADTKDLYKVILK